MADPTDTRLIAAHLAAALIGKAGGTPSSTSVVQTYFEVLDAVRLEEKNRHKVATAASGLQKRS